MYFVFQSPVDLHCHSVCIFYSSPPEKCWSRRYGSSILTCKSASVEFSSVKKHNLIPLWMWFSGIRAYEQLGNRAFGPPGKLLAACIITIHNIGGTVTQTFLTLVFTSVYMTTSMWYLSVYCFNLAMSSYLFIVKSELPLVIQVFLSKHENTEWVWKWRPGGVLQKLVFSARLFIVLYWCSSSVCLAVS